MPLFGNILGKKADGPAANPDDVVYPVHTLDGCKANHVATGWVLRFDDVLDAEKLRSSLVRTLEIGDWKKLGGKIRRGVSYQENNPHSFPPSQVEQAVTSRHSHTTQMR